MGQIWLKNDDGAWVKAAPLARTGAGWKKSKAYWRKSNATTWVKLWEQDVTPPAAPSITSLTYDEKKKQVTVKVKAPGNADVVSIDVRRSVNAYPTGRTKSSEAFTGHTKTVKPSTTYTFVVPYSKTGVTFYYSVFAVDGNGNWSTRGIKSIKVPVPKSPTPVKPTKPVTKPKPGTKPPAPAPKTYKATIKTTNSKSWTDDWSKWYDKVFQGGLNNYRGCWFYGSRLTTHTKAAKKIKKMTIRITRSSSQNGVSGQANVWLVMHDRTSPSGKPTLSGKIKIGTLGRGQTKTFTVPTSWWDNLQKQTKWKGFGLMYGDIGYTNPNYLVAYGHGTRSGELYIEYEK